MKKVVVLLCMLCLPWLLAGCNGSSSEGSTGNNDTSSVPDLPASNKSLDPPDLSSLRSLMRITAANAPELLETLFQGLGSLELNSGYSYNGYPENSFSTPITSTPMPEYSTIDGSAHDQESYDSEHFGFAASASASDLSTFTSTGTHSYSLAKLNNLRQQLQRAAALIQADAGEVEAASTFFDSLCDGGSIKMSISETTHEDWIIREALVEATDCAIDYEFTITGEAYFREILPKDRDATRYSGWVFKGLELETYYGDQLDLNGSLNSSCSYDSATKTETCKITSPGLVVASQGETFGIFNLEVEEVIEELDDRYFYTVTKAEFQLDASQLAGSLKVDLYIEEDEYNFTDYTELALTGSQSSRLVLKNDDVWLSIQVFSGSQELCHKQNLDLLDIEQAAWTCP